MLVEIVNKCNSLIYEYSSDCNINSLLDNGFFCKVYVNVIINYFNCLGLLITVVNFESRHVVA
jgi:hypothetical protein